MSEPLECLYRRVYDPSALLAAHPPRIGNPNKQLAFELACPAGASHAGPITVTRWSAATLPEYANAGIEPRAVAGFYDYAGESGTAWHLNFADPELFFGYGTPLLAQDELQALEHPLLGSIREALLAEGLPARTEDHDAGPTPVLVAGVERRASLDTHALYGNRFAAAAPDAIRAALRVYEAPRRSNLIAIAAPVGRGRYTRAQIEHILTTAYTGFLAARKESNAPITVHTGFWGCGAFGGNRRLMTNLQLLAAALAHVQLVFHAGDGLDDYAQGAYDFDAVPGEPLATTIDRIDARRYEWGVSNGT